MIQVGENEGIYTFELSTGKRFKTQHGINVGRDTGGSLVAIDGGNYDIPSFGEGEFTPRERHEIAGYMIGLWYEYQDQQLVPDEDPGGGPGDLSIEGLRKANPDFDIHKIGDVLIFTAKKSLNLCPM